MDAPEAMDAFGNFSNIDVKDEHYNEVLHRHGGRVKGAVGKVIEVINDSKEYKRYLLTLSFRHYKEYSFDPQYIEVSILTDYCYFSLKKEQILKK